MRVASSAAGLLERIAHAHGGHRAFARAGVRDDRVDHRPLHERPRGVVHQHHGAFRPERREPRRDRVRPLRATGHQHEARAGEAGRNAGGSAASAGERTSATRVTSGCAANGRSARSTMGTPAIVRNCFGVSPPRRVPRPAATTTTPTSRGKRPHQLLDVIEPDHGHAGHLGAAPRGAEHAPEAEPRGLRDPPLDRAAGPDLPAETDLAQENDVVRRRTVVQARDQRGGDGEVARRAR